MKKSKLTDNIPLKLMSIFVGILVWLIVVNIDNPTTRRSFVIHDVELMNQAYIDSMGLVSSMDEDQAPIRVYITGTRKTVSGITESDINAVADLQQAINLEAAIEQNTTTSLVMVPITVTCTGISPENIEVTPKNLSVNLQKKATQEFVINATTEGKPGRGYEIGTVTADPEKIRITGPFSLINKINQVNAVIDVDGATEDVTEDIDLSIIDKNGEPLTTTQMSYLTFERQVAVTARLWRVQTVTINAEYSGTPAQGYKVGSVEEIPSEISVAGSEDALEELSQAGNSIWITEDAIDISGKSDNMEIKVDISEYLPEGIKLTSDSSTDVFVRVNILPEGSIEYEILTSDIEVKNLSENLQVTFDTAAIDIRLKKDDESLDDPDEESIKASIDLEGREEGSYEVPVDITLPEGYELVDDVVAEINISEISDVSEVENSEE